MLTYSQNFEKLAMTTPVEAVDKLSRSALNHESIIAAMLFGYGVGLTMLKLQVMPGNTRLIYADSVNLIRVQEQINELTRAEGLAELEMCVLERLKEHANFSSIMSAGSKTSRSKVTALSKRLQKPTPFQAVTVRSSDYSSSSAVSAMSQLNKSVKSKQKIRRKKKEGDGASVSANLLRG